MDNKLFIQSCCPVPRYAQYMSGFPDWNKHMTNLIRDITIDYNIPVHHAAKLVELLVALSVELPHPEVILTHTPKYLLEHPVYRNVIYAFEPAKTKLEELLKQYPLYEKTHFQCSMIIDDAFEIDYNVICNTVQGKKEEDTPAMTEQPPDTNTLVFDPEATLSDLRWAYGHVAKGDKVDLSQAPSPGARFWYNFGVEYPIKFADIVSKYLLPKELEQNADRDLRFKDDGRTIDLARSLLEKLK